MRWIYELPTKKGDYFWVNYWSCACGCVQSSGICMVEDAKNIDEKGSGRWHKYIDSKGKEKAICFMDQPPWFGGDYISVTCFLKIKHPPAEQLGNNFDELPVNQGIKVDPEFGKGMLDRWQCYHDGAIKAGDIIVWDSIGTKKQE